MKYAIVFSKPALKKCIFCTIKSSILYPLAMCIFPPLDKMILFLLEKVKFSVLRHISYRFCLRLRDLLLAIAIDWHPTRTPPNDLLKILRYARNGLARVSIHTRFSLKAAKWEARAPTITFGDHARAINRRWFSLNNRWFAVAVNHCRSADTDIAALLKASVRPSCGASRVSSWFYQIARRSCRVARQERAAIRSLFLRALCLFMKKIAARLKGTRKYEVVTEWQKDAFCASSRDFADLSIALFVRSSSIVARILRLQLRIFLCEGDAGFSKGFSCATARVVSGWRHTREPSPRRRIVYAK